MSSKFPLLWVQKRDAQRRELTDFRNLCAFQSALLRGEDDVTLDNTYDLPQNLEQRVKVPYRPFKRPHYKEFMSPWERRHREVGPDKSEIPLEVDKLIPNYGWDGFLLTWIRVLGKGGYGLATLWEVAFEDGTKKKIVIKVPISRNADFDLELSWHMRYKEASHVVQPLDLQDIADKIRDRKGSKNRWYKGKRRFDSSQLNVLVLEYAEHGDLYTMLAKASYFGINFSNKVLWEIRECLVKGVLSVAFRPGMPDDPSSAGYFDRIIEQLNDPWYNDQFAWFQHYPNSHDVHFDLEEQNILVSTDISHTHNPIFKLHDFGAHSQNMSRCWKKWTENDYWIRRRPPKINRITPEAFTRDWDDMDLSNLGGVARFTGDNLNVGNPVAGRYGTWTNVFLIGKIMESVISKSWVSHPLRASPYQTGKTYGWRLDTSTYQHVEPELRDAVLQAQFERPADRPAPIELLRRIIERKRKGFTETDDQTRRFWETFWSRTKTASAQPPAQAVPVVAGRDPSKSEAGPKLSSGAMDALANAMAGNILSSRGQTQMPTTAQRRSQGQYQGQGQEKQRMEPQLQTVTLGSDILAKPVTGYFDRMDSNGPVMNPAQATTQGGPSRPSSGKRKTPNGGSELKMPKKQKSGHNWWW